MGRRKIRTQKTCLIRGCDNPPVARGLCQTCRAAAKAAIQRGEVTEDELIERGLLLPAVTAGRKPESAFAKQLERVKRK